VLLLALTAASLGTVMLAGCGQTGPLVLPGANTGSTGDTGSTGSQGTAGQNEDDEQDEENER
jgi:predicted small lipoprotein YifL